MHKHVQIRVPNSLDKLTIHIFINVANIFWFIREHVLRVLPTFCAAMWTHLYVFIAPCAIKAINQHVKSVFDPKRLISTRRKKINLHRYSYTVIMDRPKNYGVDRLTIELNQTGSIFISDYHRFYLSLESVHYMSFNTFKL